MKRPFCFSPERKATFDTLEKQKSPVKLSNYRTSTKYGTTDIVIQKYTNVQVTTALELEKQFQYQPMPDTQDLSSISSLSDVAPNQLVTIKANLFQLSGIKTIIMDDSKQLTKQEGIIVDHTGHMNIVLWAEYTGQLEEKKTYIFSNLRLKESNSVKYLNTPKDNTGVFNKETDHFTGPLYPMDGIDLLITKVGSCVCASNTVYQQDTYLLLVQQNDSYKTQYQNRFLQLMQTYSKIVTGLYSVVSENAPTGDR